MGVYPKVALIKIQLDFTYKAKNSVNKTIIRKKLYTNGLVLGLLSGSLILGT